MYDFNVQSLNLAKQFLINYEIMIDKFSVKS